MQDYEYQYDETNPEHLRERADAYEALAANDPIQTMSINGTWKKGFSDKEFHTGIRYRRAPLTVERAWSKPSDVPWPVCWIRMAGIGGNFLVTEVRNDGIIIGSYHAVKKDWNELGGWLHSIDRVNWLPCKTTAP